ncbi:hypothetical protein J6Y50_07070 [bacterium]|nr:hypothetical protein [bacterium]
MSNNNRRKRPDNLPKVQFIDDFFEELKEEINAAYQSKETIWDYNPTEQEIAKICEERNVSQQEIMAESRKSELRLLCLISLFELRKNRKEVERIWQEHDILFPMIL